MSDDAFLRILVHLLIKFLLYSKVSYDSKNVVYAMIHILGTSFTIQIVFIYRKVVLVGFPPCFVSKQAAITLIFVQRSGHPIINYV